LLEELAFHYRFCGKPLTRPFVEDTATWLSGDSALDREAPRRTARGWLADLERWELLVQRGSGHGINYEFAIPTLDEYFAARHLALRWIENDKRYQTCFPGSESWWWRVTKPRCPNPHCQAVLPIFGRLYRQQEYEETLLLLVGQLRSSDLEKTLLKSVSLDSKFAIKILSRCRQAHVEIASDILQTIPSDWTWKRFGSELMLSILPPSWAKRRFLWADSKTVLKSVRHIGSGDSFFSYLLRPESSLTAIGHPRLRANLDPFTEFFLGALKNRGYWSHWALTAIGRAAIEPLISTLSDNDGEVREHTASILGWIKDERAVEPLILAMKENRIEIRTAVFALAMIAEARSDERAIEVLIANLKSGSDGWSTASDGLRRTGGPALAQLIAAAKNERNGGDVRNWAVHIIGEIEDPRAVEQLVNVLQEEEEEIYIRRAAAESLGKIRDARAVDTLITLIDHSYERLRSSVTSALVRIGNSSVNPLLKVLGEDSVDVRRTAAWALGEIKDIRATEPLIKALRDTDEKVRCYAALGLGKIKHARAVEPLVAALRDNDWSVQEAACKALREISDGKTAEQLSSTLQDENRSTRYWAAEALGWSTNTWTNLQVSEAVQSLIEVLKDGDTRLRIAAIQALSRIGDVQAIEPLVQLIADPNGEVREAAAEKLLWWSDGAAVKPLLTALKFGGTELRKAAADVVTRLSGSKELELLISALKDDDAMVRCCVTLALGNMDDSRSNRILRRLLNDSDGGVRRAAEAAIESRRQRKWDFDLD
jgi:HEAT repeat protein